MSILALYLSLAPLACGDSPPPPEPEPPAIAELADAGEARAAVAAGRALAVRPGPVGVLAVGGGPPRPLGALAHAPAKLAGLLAGSGIERLVLMPGADWTEADLLALCEAARGAARPGLPCERAPLDLLEPPGGSPVVDVLSRQVHTSAGWDPAAAAAAAEPAVAAWTDCFRAARLAAPGVGGRIVLEVAVDGSGAVVDAAVTAGWDQPDFERCVAEAARSLVFEGAAAGELIALPIMLTAR